MEELANTKSVHRLSEDVIRQISAGEVITRPVNCVKELIENSLDAKASLIQITVKNGGLDLIKVKDNGIGISNRDLKIVCERYTTSKLETFNDLASISSYGFRGEALYSMSSVSNLSITTKTVEDDTGLTVEYANGIPISDIRPVAANIGTIITIEQLFHNVPSRRKHCEKSNIEYGFIMELVTKYAIHCSNSVGFNLRKDEKQSDISTSVGSQTMSNISALYGYNVGKHLVAICCNTCTEFSFSMTGVVSKPSFAVKKVEFILFINDRLVECRDLKKAVQNVYSNYLTKGFHPFVYLSLKLDPNLLDVNVHPSKNEVKYLHEDEINDLIVISIEEKLKSSSNTSAVGSPLNTGFTSLRTPPSSSSKKVNEDSPREMIVKKTPKILRIDPKKRKLEEIFSQRSILDSSCPNSGWRLINLTSVQMLREKVVDDIDACLQRLITDSQYVGCFHQGAFLIQSGEKLFVVNYEKFSEQLFYQLYLKYFGNFGSILFEAPICISELYNIYFMKFQFDSQTSLAPEDSKLFLVNKREMLKDYFAIDINTEGHLLGLPIILNGHLPDFSYLPEFIYRLTNCVNWKVEKECFRTLGMVLCNFYSKCPKELSLEQESQWKQTLEYVVYVKAKEFLRPNSMLWSSLSETTSLSALYRVFERC